MTRAIHTNGRAAIAHQWAPDAPHPKVILGVIQDFESRPRSDDPAPAHAHLVNVVFVNNRWYRVDRGDWVIEFVDGTVDLKSDANFNLLATEEPSAHARRAQHP